MPTLNLATSEDAEDRKRYSEKRDVGYRKEGKAEKKGVECGPIECTSVRSDTREHVTICVHPKP